MNDPDSNLIQFKRPKREGTLVPVRKTYDSCKHDKCFVDEGTRLVTCQNCSAKMDPFDVLLQLAHKQRRWLEDIDSWEAMRDSRLSDRYDKEWEDHKDDVCSPPSDQRTFTIWETFRIYFKGSFVSMYRRKTRLRSGPEWYGRSNHGSTVSFEYARNQLLPKTQVVR